MSKTRASIATFGLVAPVLVAVAGECFCKTGKIDYTCPGDHPAECQSIEQCLGTGSYKCTMSTNTFTWTCDYTDGTGFCRPTFSDCNPETDPCGG
jgi:hypothetical protein